ncbi:putative lipid II flippase FtsW [Janibacter hoylei]|uniref:putative lipid II flippase FtsW n=1 Tax=Janibacter hoylei TaxID=364298 RepID=UPI0021A444BE|nr:putative lipid II flippase FtsW [Janibacter hoylei]MCT1617513.1 putative lipid II flippase FtsW [Janibacter hoylei]MCT2292218.1 putative lipid II flippase FtsW [Janibacter hoylei]
MSSSAATGRGAGARSARTRLEQWAARFESPMTTYYLLLGVVGLLVGIGLVMVLSASMIVSLRENDSSFTIFLKQFVFAVAGGLALWWASRRSVAFWKRFALPAVLASIVLLGLVLTPLGFGFQGNRNWIGVGSLSIQPSEIAKIGLVLGGALVLERKQALLGSIKHALIPFVVPGALVIVGLVMLGHDLGTAMVIVAIVVGMLFAAGVPLRWFGAGLGVLAVLGYAALTLGNSRMERINVWLNPEQCAPGTELFYGICRQSVHGRYALADGGWLGVGLGASREKWGWLSEPYNDFIFAIIGEELGLLGTLAILLLFASFALAGLRLVTRTDDYFVRLATAGICTWVLIQAIINIGAVIGMLPVIGVPLPFVSSGGSSLVTSMLAVGILLSFARAEPGCSEMIAAKPSRARALLARFPSRRTSTR